MSPHRNSIDPAVPAMTMDILGSVLNRTGNPGELGKYLTDEIRELTGAQCVLLVQHLELAGQVEHRIVSLNPARRLAEAETAEMRQLMELVCLSTGPRLWQPDGNDAAAPLLRQLGFGLSMGIPLKAGAFHVGALLALGLPDDKHVDAVRELLQTLSTIVAMSLRNAFLYEQQEQIIQARTADLQKANQELRASLDVKVVLLKEVHHRVKNNLQIIASLLNLQGGQTQNTEALAILKTTQSRIRAMALLHESLYRSENLARIHFGTYLRFITTHLLKSFGARAAQIRVQCEAPGVELCLDRAVPCGLIINELVCNSLKYGFPENRPGLIQVEMRNAENNQVILTVADNGVGLPESFNIEKKSGLGLQLVGILTAQLGGNLEIKNQNGARFRIVFQNKTT